MRGGEVVKAKEVMKNVKEEGGGEVKLISKTYKRSANTKLKRSELLEKIRPKRERIKCLRDSRNEESKTCDKRRRRRKREEWMKFKERWMLTEQEERRFWEAAVRTVPERPIKFSPNNHVKVSQLYKECESNECDKVDLTEGMNGKKSAVIVINPEKLGNEAVNSKTDEADNGLVDKSKYPSIIVTDRNHRNITDRTTDGKFVGDITVRSIKVEVINDKKGGLEVDSEEVTKRLFGLESIENIGAANPESELLTVEMNYHDDVKSNLIQSCSYCNLVSTSYLENVERLPPTLVKSTRTGDVNWPNSDLFRSENSLGLPNTPTERESTRTRATVRPYSSLLFKSKSSPGHPNTGLKSEKEEKIRNSSECPPTRALKCPSQRIMKENLGSDRKEFGQQPQQNAPKGIVTNI